MKTEKKYQHFVPKFYLRFFSNDGKSVGTYIFKHQKYVKIAPLNSIGGSNYLYGEDGEIEDWFQELEGKWDKILKEIINSNSLNISIEEYVYILMFIYLSDARNKANADLQNKFINELSVINHNLSNSDTKYKFTDKIAEFDIPNYNSLAIMNDIIPLLFDLKLVLIINDTNNQFITSDCIVSRYNQFLLEKNFKQGYAYASVGLECFVPISPKHCLCLYDNDVYESKSKGHIIIIKNPTEINKLNKMFIHNSDKNLFFNNTYEKNRLDILLKKQSRIKNDDTNIFKSVDNEYIIKMPIRCIKENFNISFLRTKKEANNIKINFNSSAPIRKYAEKRRLSEKDNTSKDIINKIDGKKFYLQKKD